MSYNLDQSDTNRFQGMELVFERIEGLKPGQVFRMKLTDTSILSKTRYLIYEWLNLNKIKPFFRIQTLSTTGELTIIRKGVDISNIEEVKDKEVLDSTQEYLLQEMIRKNDARGAKDFILGKWKEGEIDEQTHSKLWMRYKDVYKLIMRVRNPREWPKLRLEEVDRHRLDHCPFYQDCLDQAALGRWSGFTCSFCDVFIRNTGKTFYGNTWEGELDENSK